MQGLKHKNARISYSLLMPLTEAAIFSALKSVKEPDQQRDIVALNMVRKVAFTDDGHVSLYIELTPSAKPMKSRLEGDIKKAVILVSGVKKVTIHFAGETGGATDTPRTFMGDVKNVIGIASGKGGVGKSTVSVNIAVALQHKGYKVGLLDADIYGPNLPLMTGVLGEEPLVTSVEEEGKPPVNVIEPVMAHGIKLMSMGFLLGDSQPVMWRGPMLNSALRQFFQQVNWGDLDFLLVDLPPGTGDVQISLLQLVTVAGIIHVTTPQEVAMQDVRRGIAMFREQHVPVLGIIENMSGFECPKCGHTTNVFGSGGGLLMANGLGVPFLGSIPLSESVRSSGDKGLPVSLEFPDGPQAQAFSQAADQVLARLDFLRQQAIRQQEERLSSPAGVSK